MSRLTLQDSRRLKFTLPALLDAALTFDREHNGWIWRGTGHSLVIDGGGGGAVTIQAQRVGAAEPETVNRSPAWVAAALLHYCFRRRIPVPRNGAKTLEVLPDGVAMVLEIAIDVPALELTAETFAVAERQCAAGAAVSVAPVAETADTADGGPVVDSAASVDAASAVDGGATVGAVPTEVTAAQASGAAVAADSGAATPA